ncbi:rotamase-domain-containing protein [Rhizopogon vinicolor AM-OR11-026]|uniref:Peptidyl-prolyl cis-trans isomerase n=1 Tax=Rhizopogon vinicolor AM-OR11-026 TaxID=1314800 RepID=A0A1B7N3T6_9AGAM|nr:rotamase-domain-containing protein [Rhizopogon vinicolor AM-OR11-026]
MSSDWEIRMSNSKGIPYYFNATTKQSSWDAPSELSDEQIKSLPGAHHLSSGSSGGVETITASHLLVKHKDSRRPSSWKEANITRTKEEAIEILRGYQAQFGDSREKFEELANLHSDCSSHSQKGNLGPFAKGQMQKPFEEAAFALQVGEFSDITSTDSGVHIILRTA